MESLNGFDIPKILNFGPVSVKSGQDFNIQTNGESAIWLKINKSSNSLVVKIDDISIKPFIKDELLTCNVPKKLYQKPGEHKIYLKDESTGLTSNIVIFTVI